jgi:hypothetical protein
MIGRSRRSGLFVSALRRETFSKRGERAASVAIRTTYECPWRRSCSCGPTPSIVRFNCGSSSSIMCNRGSDPRSPKETRLALRRWPIRGGTQSSRGQRRPMICRKRRSRQLRPLGAVCAEICAYSDGSELSSRSTERVLFPLGRTSVWPSIWVLSSYCWRRACGHCTLWDRRSYWPHMVRLT